MQVLTLWCRGEMYEFNKPIIRSWAKSGTVLSSAGTVLSPLPGKVIKVIQRCAGPCHHASKLTC